MDFSICFTLDENWSQCLKVNEVMYAANRKTVDINTILVCV